MEHPLHFHSQLRRKLAGLARSLFAADQTLEAHERLLRDFFVTEIPGRRRRTLAERTLRWVSARPRPRLRSLLDELQSDTLLRSLTKKHEVRLLPQVGLRAWMRPLPGLESLPLLETAGDLANWLRLDPEQMFWFADLKDWNGRAVHPLIQHYSYRFFPKSDGGVRLLELPKRQMKVIQRQILDGILAPVALHDAVHGFRRGRSQLTFAAPHVGRACVLRLDLQDFFLSISGPRVQALFRTLGYPEPVADLLGGLCSSTAPSRLWKNSGLGLSGEEIARARLLCMRPHLPQGAPTSPALANLCAFRLDRRLDGLAKALGVRYTRYADDLAFSGEQRFARAGDRFALHVAAIASEEGFSVQHRKTRLMRASQRQRLAGLLVNAHLNLSRVDLERLEATLMNCLRYGPWTQNHEAHPNFRQHLEGRVAYAEMVGVKRAGKLRQLFEQVMWAE